MSHSQTGLSAGTTYAFKVRARNAVGFSNYSTILSIVTGTVPSDELNEDNQSQDESEGEAYEFFWDYEDFDEDSDKDSDKEYDEEYYE